MDYSQKSLYKVQRRVESESHSNSLIQAIPKSHNIRPIVQIKQKQARIEDQLYLTKRKSDNHLANGSRAPGKYRLDAVRSSKSYSQYMPGPAGPMAQARQGISRNYTRVPIQSYFSNSNSLKKDLDNRLLTMDQKMNEQATNQNFGAIMLESQISQCRNPFMNASRQFDTKRTAIDTTPKVVQRQININQFPIDMLRASNCSIKVQVPFTRHSLPLKPSNQPITSKKLEGDDCDPDDGSMWSDRSDKSKGAVEFNDENYNPFGSDQKRKVVRFITQSSQCDNTDTTFSQDSARSIPFDNTKSLKNIKVTGNSSKRQSQESLLCKEQKSIQLTKKSASDLVQIVQNPVVYRQRQRSISIHKKQYNVKMK